jgi:hypothetical protein
MKYVATANIKLKISVGAEVKNKITATATIKTLSPVGETCPDYDLIDGGTPSTVYSPINGFNLISGGTP